MGSVVHIIPALVETESFVVISETPPDPSQHNHIDWYWSFTREDEPLLAFFQHDRIWIKTHKRDVGCLQKYTLALLAKDRMYVARDLFVGLSRRMKRAENLFIIQNGTCQ